MEDKGDSAKLMVDDVIEEKWRLNSNYLYWDLG